MKTLGKLATAFVLVSCFQNSNVFAQILEHRYYKTVPNPVMHSDRRVVESRVVERKVISEPSTVILSDADAVKRSNYQKRLQHLSEQINMGYSKGWLSRAQFDDLSQWHSSVAKEEFALREAGYGRVRASDVDLMEKHMTGLAFAINKNIDAGSKAALAQ